MIFRSIVPLIPQLLFLSPILEVPVYGTTVTEYGGDFNSYKKDYKEEPQIISWYNEDKFKALLMDVGKKCMSRDPAMLNIISRLIISTDDEDPMKTVVPMVFDMLEDYCDEKDAAQFEAAMHKFQKCSGIDIESYYETFSDSVVGAAITCGRYAWEVASKFDDLQYSDDDGDVTSLFPLPRIPEQCVESFMGDTPLGNALRNSLEHPGLDAKCYKELSETLPECTLKKWPIPIPGFIFRVSSCLNSELVPTQEKLCDMQFKILGSCLKDSRVLQGVKQDDATCGQWIKDCAAAGSTFVGVPAPLNALPLSDLCQSRIEFNQDSALIYDGFQKSCVTDDDRKYWSEGGGKKSLSSLKRYVNGGSESEKGGFKFSTFLAGLLTSTVVIGVGLFVKNKMDTHEDFTPLGYKSDMELS